MKKDTEEEIVFDEEFKLLDSPPPLTEVFGYTDCGGGICLFAFKDQAERLQAADTIYKPGPVVRFVPESELNSALMKIKHLEQEVDSLMDDGQTKEIEKLQDTIQALEYQMNDYKRKLSYHNLLSERPDID